MTRPSSAALNDILGHQFKVLDDGFVRVVDYMGADESIVQAARVSYGKGTKKVSEDEGLIRYLIRHSHTTPFEMCELKLHVRVPMDCWRQWIRHRTANVNEYSTRYSIAINATKKTSPGEWRLQSASNKQGSEGGLSEFPGDFEYPRYPGYLADPTKPDEPGEYLTRREQAQHEFASEIYQERIDFGVAREQARKDLPLSTYTEAYWKIDLHNLLRFLSLRMDSHAQFEIRQYANVIGEEIVSRWVPLTWKAFNDYDFRRDAVLLSARECQVYSKLILRDDVGATLLAQEFGWVDQEGKPKNNRELAEFIEKVKKMGGSHLVNQLHLDNWKTS